MNLPVLYERKLQGPAHRWDGWGFDNGISVLVSKYSNFHMTFHTDSTFLFHCHNCAAQTRRLTFLHSSIDVRPNESFNLLRHRGDSYFNSFSL